MIRRIRRLFSGSEAGQDLVEYTLILSFVCLAGAAMYIGISRDTKGLWSIMNSRLANANQSSS
ncbi:MAG: hypothetical protein HYX27_06110 [Acidobacteria bacterium]|nr:hypothetical protein [Acidobacteriota bacterium]